MHDPRPSMLQSGGQHSTVVAFDKKLFEMYYAKAEACTRNDDRLVQLVDLMISMLKQSGRAKEKYVHAKSMAPHPANRGGCMMQAHKMFRKGAKIIKVGVSLSRCGPAQAVAFENNPITNHVRKNMRKTVDSAPQYFQNVAPGESMIEAGSVGCGHWNQFIAAIIDCKEVPEEFRGNLCEHGKTHLDPERLCKDQPVLKIILDLGLKFTVIEHAVETEYPKLPNLIQKSLNVDHHIGEGYTYILNVIRLGCIRVSSVDGPCVTLIV